jgi:hypothetical protein
MQTFLMKIIFPALWIPLFGLGAVTVLFIPSKGEFPMIIPLIMWVAGSFFIYWTCIRLKAVRVDENFLYVSNYLKEISIPLAQIYDVTENLWINIHPVTIHLKTPSEFGEKIVFMPTLRYFAWFQSHPIVDELKTLAAAKQFLH